MRDGTGVLVDFIMRSNKNITDPSKLERKDFSDMKKKGHGFSKGVPELFRMSGLTDVPVTYDNIGGEVEVIFLHWMQRNSILESFNFKLLSGNHFLISASR